MTRGNDAIEISGVSKFYGEVLGVNRVDLTVMPGITGLVGPNGSGKSTLMNLIAGLLTPTKGTISILGLTNREPQLLYQHIGYCAQVDSFPPRMTGRQFLINYLRVHGFDKRSAAHLAHEALTRVSLLATADRRIDGYSKGMRQRIKLAQSICHQPRVMVLDEPLNGLDPMARAEIIDLFLELATGGAHILVSSHILHEVDLISDRVVFLSNGYVVAEGDVQGIQGEIKHHPIQIRICSEAAPVIAARVFDLPDVVEARLHDDRRNVFVRTRNADRFFLAFNQMIMDHPWTIEAVSPVDESVEAVYQYLVADEPVSQ